MKPDPRKCSWSSISERSEVAPEILFTPVALKWIRAMVECHDSEIGFMGLVNEINQAYVIIEIFYPKHCLVSSATCEIAPEGEVELAQNLIDANRADDISKIRFWGHSHHTMGTNPSMQDDIQAIEKMKTNGAYYIRAICNRDGELSVSFFDYARQIKFENIKWAVYYDFNTILQNVISAINMESQSKEKVLAIKSAISIKINFSDKEYNEIVERVRELKKTQLPAEQGHLPANPHNYHQGDLFNDVDFSGYEQPPETKRGKNFHRIHTRVIGEPLVTPQEIMSAIDRVWEEI